MLGVPRSSASAALSGQLRTGGTGLPEIGSATTALSGAWPEQPAPSCLRVRRMLVMLNSDFDEPYGAAFDLPAAGLEGGQCAVLTATAGVLFCNFCTCCSSGRPFRHPLPCTEYSAWPRRGKRPNTAYSYPLPRLCTCPPPPATHPLLCHSLQLNPPYPCLAPGAIKPRPSHHHESHTP